MVTPEGGISKFLSNQVIFKPKSRRDLRKFLQETKGKILHTGRLAPPPPGVSKKKIRKVKTETGYYLIQVDLTITASPSRLAQKIGVQPKAKRGNYRFNEEGARLINTMLERQQKGDRVEPNLLGEFMSEPDIISFSEEEWMDDSEGYDDFFIKVPVVEEGVRLQKAWQYIDLLNPPAAQAISSRGLFFEDAVWVAFIDDGFKASVDLLPTPLQLDGAESTYVPEANSWGGYDAPDYEWDFNVMDEPINLNQSTTSTSIFCSGTPTCWHGLVVQSTASALLNNQSGIAGTGGQVIYPMLFKNHAAYGEGERLVSLYQSAAMVSQAVYWGADIINMSFGYWGFGYDVSDCRDITQCSYFRDAVREAIDDSQVIIVAAAGNQNWNLTTNSLYPCEFPGVICVGSGRESRWIIPDGPDPDTNPDGGSNYSANVALYAPPPFFGLFSRECLTNAPCAITVEEFASSAVTPGMNSGTSLASPYVAGVIAMMKALKPTLTPLEALEILQITASPSPDETMRAPDANPASAGIMPPGYINPYRAIQEVIRREGITLPPDENNTRDDAVGISMNGGVESGTDGPTIFHPFEVAGSIVPGGDEDWYRFSSNVNYSSLEIRLSARNVAGTVGDRVVELNGPYFLQHAETTVDHLTPIMINPLPPNGLANYLKIYGDADTFGNYRLTLQQRDVVLPPDRYDDQSPSGELRNETQETATWLRRIALGGGGSSSELGEVQEVELSSPFGVDLTGFNFDRGSDNDYFQLQLPAERCLSPEEIREFESSDTMGGTVQYEYRAGYFAISLIGSPLSHHYPDSIHVELFDGTTWSPIPASSLIGSVSAGRGLRIECPHSIVSSGVIGIRIRSSDDQFERRNYYNLNLKYVPWSFQIRVSRDLLPSLEHLVDEATLLGFLTDIDLGKIDLTKPRQGFFPKSGLCRSTACPDDPDPEYYLFDIGQQVTDFMVQISSSPACQMTVRLLDSGKRLMREGENFDSATSDQKVSRLGSVSLNQGRYLVEVDGKTPCNYSLSMGLQK